MKEITVEKDKMFIKDLQRTVENDGPFSSWELFKLSYQTSVATMTTDIHKLKSLQYLPHVSFLNHQIECAKTVMQKMNGRAILADEVGLGKTIEAGLILKEYMIKGLVKNVLILVPASLVNQWVQELNEKFYIPAVSYRKNYSWKDHHVFVTSIDTAKREPHRSEILQINYDLIIVDEAHKLKNNKTLNYSFVHSLKKKYCLLLTATPIQNKLIEIFNLIALLKPGYLGNYDAFIKKYGKNNSNRKNDEYLNELIRQVMIRNTRKETDLNQVKRHVETVWIVFSEKEQHAYNQLTELTESFSSLTKITFLKELCSSREACYLSLLKITNHSDNPFIQKLIRQVEQLPHHIKAKKLVELINRIGDKKVIVFTEYRATQYYLQWYLQEHGITSVPFSGGFKKSKKDWMKQLFKNHAQVLIATEAGSEGINLQFCHHLINFDLPWNPMKLEQRIGRIHRYGQKHDVYIYNFAILETIEEHIMKLLYDKINLFENVIGQLDVILAKLDISNLESEVKEMFQESTSLDEIKIKLNNFTSIINDMKEEQHDGSY